MSATLLAAVHGRLFESNGKLAKNAWNDPQFESLRSDPLPTKATVRPSMDEPDVARLSEPSAGSSLSVHLITLGELRCVYNGADTDLPKQKLRFALLVYLAMERSAPREKVLALLWPEVDEDRARARLKQTIFELRQAFGTSCIESKGSELRVADDVTLDARDFGT